MDGEKCAATLSVFTWNIYLENIVFNLAYYTLRNEKYLHRTKIILMLPFRIINLACKRNMSIRDSKEAKKFCLFHLRRNDVKEIACQRILLSEDVVFISFEGDAKHVDDKRAR